MIRSLAKATERLLGRPGRLRQCMLNLGMDMPEAQLLSRIKKLRVAPLASKAPDEAKIDQQSEHSDHVRRRPRGG